ncbi:MAG: glycoside hydrolase family 36 protein [Candidatus Binataceae bacterium]
MEISSLEATVRHGGGAAQAIAAVHFARGPECAATLAGVELKASFDYSASDIVARARIVNHGERPVRLDAMTFNLATGFDSSAPARFFKHGYQSWSGSGARVIGAARAHRHDTAHSIVRINHQSETTRPADSPEAATSELFTIVECDGRPDRVLAGFVSAAHALTTMTVPSPDLIRARAILDGVELGAGETREIEPLYFARSDESAAQMASRWAAKLGSAMGARASAAYQRGWCSWYHYFHAITEDAIRANLRALAAMRPEFPIEVVQLDDGFQSVLGDWDSTNAKFPSGLKRLAEEIRSAGFEPGIWTAPFLAARDARIMREHPDWFIRHKNDGPLRAGYNPNWTTGEDKFAYALDPGNPAFAAHLERLFRKLVEEFGYSYLKLDFLYAGAAQGARHNQNLTRAESFRRGLEAIRRGAGERAFILGCGCPLGAAIGIVDGMRIGPDVAPYWGSEGSGDPSTVHALDAIIARSFMHRQWWLNDPDCLMLRARETKLTPDERGALAATIAGSGGMLLISDDMAILGGDEGEIYRAAAALGAEIDSGCAGAPVLAADLMTTAPVRTLVKETANGAIAIIVNRGDEAASVLLATLGIRGAAATIRTLTGTEAPAPEHIDLAPHSARIVKFVR